jgi:hypothetical protein
MSRSSSFHLGSLLFERSMAPPFFQKFCQCSVQARYVAMKFGIKNLIGLAEKVQVNSFEETPLASMYQVCVPDSEDGLNLLPELQFKAVY